MKEQNSLYLENIADLLWLSKFTGMQSIVTKKIENKKQEKPKPKPKIDDEVEDNEDSSEPKIEEPQDDLEVHTDNQDNENSPHTKQKKANAIQSPKKLALSNYRKWEKAFKFINLKQYSRNKYELDEDKTVENIASTRVFDLVFKRVQEKSFFLTIVIDRGETMELWDELIKNFEQMLLTMGIFARVSVYYWDTEDTKPKLYADRELKKEISQKLVTIDGKRNLVWVMSDCIAPSWRSSEAFKSIDVWSKKSFTSILQMFPKEMWMGTMLFKGKHIRLSSVSFNSLNQKLKTKPSKREKNALKIPIVSFDPYALQAWAKVVINAKNNSISGIELENLDFPLVKSIPKKEITPEMRMQRFYSQASPTAQKLAFYMSVLPIDFKVTRILQEERLPNSNQAHVAEVFLGGLIERTKKAKSIYYDFYPKIREELNANISADESFNIMESMSDFVSSHLGIGFDFKALLSDPHGAFEGDIELSSESLAYARLASKVLKRKGGKLYHIAKSLDENIERVGKEKIEEVQLSLADVIYIETGKSYTKETYTNDLSGIPLIRVATLKKDIKDMQLLETDYFDRIDRNKLKNSSKKIANECILFATINHNRHKPTIFRPTKNMPFIYIGTDIYGLMISSDKLLLEYLYFLLYSENILHQIRNYLTGGIMPRLNKTNLTKLLKNIPLISLEEQRQYIENQKIENKEGGVINMGEKHTIPNQLTSKLGKTTIVGREKELKEIDTLLKESSPILLLTGMGGIGKSNIVSSYLNSQKEQFDYYGFFEGLESFTNELKARLNLKSEKPDELFWEALSILSTLEGEKLLVLDDVKDIEENQAYIDGVLGLKEFGYKILITSREEIDEKIVKPYYLDVLSLADAKALFNSIHEVEDEAVLEEILGYLDYHAFFVEKTAHSIKKTLTAKMIRDKFRKGEFAQISVKRKEGFDRFLNKLFTLDGLDEEETLMLKQLSALPSFEIDFNFLETLFQKKEDSEFEELLDFLSEKGWLTKLEGAYKLHQIIKEYLLANHKPTFEEIEVVVDSLIYLIKNSTDAQVAVNNRENIIYFESLVMPLERLGIENEKVGVFFERFGNIYHHLGLYQKAESLLSKALKIREKVLGDEHPDTATSYNNLAGLYRSMGEYQKAEPLSLKALKISEKVLGDEHPNTATSYHNLAGLCWNMGEYQKAEPLYLKALKISEKVLGEEHPDTATGYNNLAVLYESMGKYQKAEPLYLKALQIREKVLGEEHPDTAKSYNNLAVLYWSMGEYQKVEPLYLKALKISKKVLGEEHPNTAKSYNNLARLYVSIGEYQKAETLYLKALKISEKVLGEEHPDTATSYNNLAILYESMGEYQKAEPLYLKTLKIIEKVLGENHPDIATNYNGLANLYYSQGEYAKAKKFIEKCIRVVEQLDYPHINIENLKTALSEVEINLKKEGVTMKLKILFMSANPSQDLNIDEEIRNVKMAIQSYARHESVELIYRPATRLKDMINILNSEQPHILHFTGHGYDKSGELYMVDDDTKGDKIIPYEALFMLFDTVKEDNLKLVFLNSCYSKVQADAILESIDYVIGMNDEIEDDSAKTLSTQFYSSFVAGVSLVNSFKQAKVEVIANHFSQKNIPELLTRSKEVKDFSIIDIVGEEEKKQEGRKIEAKTYIETIHNTGTINFN